MASIIKPDATKRNLTGAINTIGKGSTSSTRKPPTDDDADTEASATEASPTELGDAGRADSVSASADASEPSTPTASTTEPSAKSAPDLPVPNEDPPDSNGSESDDNT